MNESQRSTVSALFSLAITLAALFVTQRFILPLAWAAIICIATWPLHLWILARCRHSHVLASSIAVLISALVFVAPLAIAFQQILVQAPALATWIADVNNSGMAPPEWLARVPVVGAAIVDWWHTTLSQPHGLAHLLQDGSGTRLHNASDMLRAFGASLLHRVIDAGFALLALFVFYQSGERLVHQLQIIAGRYLGVQRWKLYATKVPVAIRATVNGLVLVGLAEGVLLGFAYQLAGVPSALLWAAATGVLAIIPFGAPIAFGAVAALLAFQGHTQAAVAVGAFGAVVLFVADHFVRPKMIGSATELPFLAVLMGILGGVETLGLVGLFVGPVVMTLLVTLWREAHESVTAQDGMREQPDPETGDG